MLQAARENGPAALVPLAWTVIAGAHIGAVSTRSLIIAHGVMSVLLATFAVLSWREMSSGALRGWRQIIAVGFFVTLAGFVGLRGEFESLVGVSLFGWMLLPVVGFVHTGQLIAAAGAGEARRYHLAAVITGLGTVVYLAGTLSGWTRPTLLVGLGLVAVGQTIGIVDASLRS